MIHDQEDMNFATDTRGYSYKGYRGRDNEIV